MGDFFRSTRFKVLVVILVVLFAFMIRGAYTGGAVPLLQKTVSAITTPVQRGVTALSNGVMNFFNRFLQASSLEQENESLREQNRVLRQQLVDYERFQLENEQLREYLEIKEEHEDFAFQNANVIGRDATERFYSFTIDRGSMHGVKERDPVITADGLVGMVSEVSFNSSKVLTILDVALEVGAYDVRTQDLGVVTGTVELAAKGNCRVTLLPLDSEIATGDLLYTSGYGGYYPRGLAIGTVTEVGTEPSGMSRYAILNPFSEIKNIQEVLVITSFEGQDEE